MSSPKPLNHSGADDDDVSASVIACGALMTFFASLAVTLRFYARGKLLHTLAVEDWCILVSLVFAAASTSFCIRQATVGLGRHIWTITQNDIQNYLQASYIHSSFYHLSLAFTKVSILLLYLRFLAAHDFTRRATKVVLGTVIIYSTWVFAMHMSMCIPLQKAWDRTVEGRCHGPTLWWSVTYLHIITDFMIFVLPIPVVATMTIPIRQKAGLLVVFALGFFVCLISILRAVWLKQMVNKRDMTWDLVSISKWTLIEVNMAVICACLTTLKPILTKLDPWMNSCLPLHRRRNHPETLTSGGPDSSSRPATIGSMPLQALRRFRQSLTLGSTGTTVRLESKDAHTTVKGGGGQSRRTASSGSSTQGGTETDAGASKSNTKVLVDQS